MKKILLFTLSLVILIFICIPYFSQLQKRDSDHMVRGSDPKVVQDTSLTPWEQVEEFELKGQVIDASILTDKILTSARENNESTEIVKAYIYKTKFARLIPGNNPVNTLHEIENEIAISSFPTKQILHNIYAQLLRLYFDNNSTIPLDSTKQYHLEDIESWPNGIFRQKIEHQFHASLEPLEQLQQLDLVNYIDFLDIEAPIQEGELSLYNFLAQNAIDYYLSTYHDGYNHFNKRFKKILWGTDSEFVNYSFEQDTIQYPVVKSCIIYQNLYRKVNKTAYQKAKFTVTRLKFAHKLLKEQETYHHSLETLNNDKTIKTHDQDKYNLEEEYLDVLRRYIDDSSTESQDCFKYNLADALYHYSLIKEQNSYRSGAVKLCNNIIENNHNNIEQLQAICLKNKITTPKVSLEIERIVYPQQPSLSKVTYHNIDSLYLSFYPLSTYETRSNIDSILNQKLTYDKPIFKNGYALPCHKPYYQTSTEIIIPPLNGGRYLILTSYTNHPSKTEEILCYNYLTVSKFSCNVITKPKEVSIQVCNRKSGRPLYDASVCIKRPKSTDQPASEEKGRTNNLGIFKSKLLKTHLTKDTEICIAYKGDTLRDNISEWHEPWISSSESVNKTKAVMNLFTDRSIYRPGQTVYFKGILYESIVTNGNQLDHSVVPHQYVTITLNNSQQKSIKTLHLKTNAYGSVHGSIVLPHDGVTGDFRLKMGRYQGNNLIDRGYYLMGVDESISKSVYISVEEYKRPTFNITIKPIKDLVIENKRVKIRGEVKAFNDLPISNGLVKYSITRQPILHWYESTTGQKVIKTGSCKTDINGKFSFDYIAKASSRDKQNHSNDRFTVTVEVQSKNGETQEKSYEVFLYNNDIQTTIDLKEETPQDEPLRIDLTTKSYNGNFINTQLKVSIYKLPSYKSSHIARHWSFPDTVSISKDQFTKLFPYYIYKKINDVWDINNEKPVYQKRTKWSSNHSLQINNLKQWKCGNYKAVIEAINKNQDTVTSTQEFKVSPALSEDKILPIFFDASVKIKDDSTILAHLKTSEQELNVFVLAYARGNEIKSKLITIHKGVNHIDIPFHDDKETEINFVFYLTKHGRFMSQNVSVTYIPSIINKLHIETVSFRDKIEPKGKERWSFRIVDDSSKNVNNVEMLASMYDASLDMYKTHHWLPQLYDLSYNHFIPSVSLLNRPTLESNHLTKNVFLYSTNSWSLNWFGLSLYSQSATQKQYLKQLIHDRDQKSKSFVYGFILDKHNNPIPNVLFHIEGDASIYKTYDNGFYILPADKNITFQVYKYGYEPLFCSTNHSGIKNFRLSRSYNHDGLSLFDYMDQLQKAKQISMCWGSSKEVCFHDPLYEPIPRFFTLIDDDVDNSNSATLGFVEMPEPNLDKQVTKADRTTEPQSLLYVIDGVISTEQVFERIKSSNIIKISTLNSPKAVSLYGIRGANGAVIVATNNGFGKLPNIKIRENLKETAFFYPELHTDKDGVTCFEFDSPEAMTRWKLMLFAHNKDFDFGQKTLTTVTQKKVFITPNVPRFLREGDRVVFSATIDNLTDEKQMGSAILVLYDATTDKEIAQKVIGLDASKPFTIKAKNSQSISWKFTVPSNLQTLKYKMVAKTPKHSDGEANVLLVLPKKRLVTERLPIWVNPHSTEQVTFENLKGTQYNATDHQMVLQYTPNTLWNVVEALPYLIEYPHGCAEQTFSKYYANTITQYLLGKHPKIRTLLKSWKDNPAMTIERMNSGLRSSLLEATPWIDKLDNDTKRKAKLATLLDSTTLQKEQRSALERVRKMQLSSGAFSWFANGRANEYITQHILVTLSHIQNFDVDKGNRTILDAIAKNAIGYLDKQFTMRFRATKDNTLKYINLKPLDIHYLYTRSHFIKEMPMPSELKKIVNKQLQSIKENWILGTMYEQAMIAICFQNMGEHKAAKQILKSFDQYAITSPQKGMYWERDSYGWFWNNSQLETHTMIMDAYQQVEGDSSKSARMKQALLYMKKNQHWATTKATTEAIYALLMTGTSMDAIKMDYTIKIGDRAIDQIQGVMKSEEKSTGNIEVQWTPEIVDPKMATIAIENRGNSIGSGAAYWHYWQDINDIEPNSNAPVAIQKRLFKQVADGNTLRWVLVDSKQAIKQGDRVKIELLVHCKEDLEFVHLKDLRASGFEPLDVISTHHYKPRVSYYQSTKDVVTNFYFDTLRKGKYLFEYEVRANNKGEYTGGNATIESMYAPEYGNTSKSQTITIQ
ncbi:alpha-2-macroglobulin family protein [Prolixibacteraceae bacterium]|nr:alpha-2-macroglobulin family protein [Prolixibacteraceae bacterium]